MVGRGLGTRLVPLIPAQTWGCGYSRTCTRNGKMTIRGCDLAIGAWDLVNVYSI